MGLEVNIQKTIVLDGIPSASGIAKLNSGIFIIGDNSPFLYKLDEQFNLTSKEKIYSTENLVGNTIPKKIKPDFEAFEAISDTELIVFGSGSNDIERDCFLRILLGEKIEVKTYNISPFYAHLKSLDMLQGSELNIEAVAFYEKKIYLFNRRKNVIFVFDYETFVGYVEGKNSLPNLNIIEVQLPKIKSIESGFSGATITKNNHLIFTASLEDTPNAYDDGAVLGSFIGKVHLNKIQEKEYYEYVFVESGKDPIKIESVAINNEISDKELDLLLVTDSDGGDSLLLAARLSWA